jgi:putative oxidoreductase
MSALAKLDRPVLLAARVLAVVSCLVPLLTRLTIGWAFHLTGQGKLEHFDRTVDFFTSLNIPMPELNAAFVSRLEFWGGLLLLVGLGTRLVAFLLSSTMVVALMTADRVNFLGALKGTGDAGLTDVSAYVFLLFLLWLIFFGPGLLSLDALLFRRWRTRLVVGTEPATK